MWKLVKVFVISEKILTDYWELLICISQRFLIVDEERFSYQKIYNCKLSQHD